MVIEDSNLRRAVALRTKRIGFTQRRDSNPHAHQHHQAERFGIEPK